MEAYKAAIVRLATDPELYRAKCRECPEVRAQSFDSSCSWGAALRRALGHAMDQVDGEAPPPRRSGMPSSAGGAPDSDLYRAPASIDRSGV